MEWRSEMDLRKVLKIGLQLYNTIYIQDILKAIRKRNNFENNENYETFQNKNPIKICKS